MDILTTECYKTSDGVLFEDPDKAKSHQEDILGEALDNLLPHDARGNITQIDRFNILTGMMEDPKLPEKIKAIHRALTYTED